MEKVVVNVVDVIHCYS